VALVPALARSLLALSLALGLAACDDLSDFRGSYSEEIVAGSFVRSCFADKTRLTLAFDPDRVFSSSSDAPVNTISTDDGTFQATPLEPITKLNHDHLNEFDFPGPQRLRNYMLRARPRSGPLAGRDALVVISLLASDLVEVRIIARSADDAGPCPGGTEATDAGTPPLAAAREYFGLWRLNK
jgi:hypothetical protein